MHALIALFASLVIAAAPASPFGRMSGGFT